MSDPSFARQVEYMVLGASVWVTTAALDQILKIAIIISSRSDYHIDKSKVTASSDKIFHVTLVCIIRVAGSASA